MSNFFDDYLKLNPLEGKVDKSKEKEKEKLKDDELDDEGGGKEEDDE